MGQLNFDLKAVSIYGHVARKHDYLQKYRQIWKVYLNI